MPWHPSDLTYIQLLPTFTATAFYHKKLSRNLQRNFDETLGQAERWATRDYPKVLAQADGSSRKRLRAAAAEMGLLTGLSPDVILKYNFRIPPSYFLDELLGAESTPLGVLDSRSTKAEEAASGYSLNWYPVLSSLYLRGELHFESRVPYASLLDPSVNVFFLGWHCQVGEGDTSCLATPRTWLRLQRAMRENPSLRVMITNGYYDTGCPYFGTKMAVSQLAPNLKARVSVIAFQAGHIPPPETLRAAVGRFERSASSERNE
jgi:carboxypeptidase C (cathepsin A)